MLEVSVCPRSAQRLAVRLEGCREARVLAAVSFAGFCMLLQSGCSVNVVTECT